MGLLGLALAAWLFYLVFIFPFTANSKLTRLERHVTDLKRQLAGQTPPPKENRVESYNKKDYEQIYTAELPNPPTEMPIAEEQPTTKPRVANVSINLEKQLGTRVPVWIGSISLAFAGFYMIQYSIEAGLLSPAVRLSMSSMFGALLLIASLWVKSKPNFANGKRIMQALAGAGIAVLYFTIYAATNIYNFLPALAGFIGMASVTALSIILSLSYGAPIAFIGLLSGFATPGLIGGEPNAPQMFTYLYLVLLGTFIVIRKNNWWWLAAVAMVFASVWIVFWSLNYPLHINSLCLGIFIIAVNVTLLAMSNSNTPSALKYVTYSASILLMAAFTIGTNYGYQEWTMFSIVATGAIVLAMFDQKNYSSLPWLALCIISLMIVNWQTTNTLLLLQVNCGFAALFILSGYFMAWRKQQNNVNWLLQAAIANIIFFILAYFKIKVGLFHKINTGLIIDEWGSVAFIFAVIWSYTAKIIHDRAKNNNLNLDYMFSIACIAATVFLSMGAIICLKAEFLAIAFATELLSISLLTTKISNEYLNNLVLALTLAVCAALSFQYVSKVHTFADNPALHLGLPATLMAISSLIFRGRIIDQNLQTIEYICVALFALMGQPLLKNFLTRIRTFIDWDFNYALSGMLDNYYMLLGMAIFFIAQRQQRTALYFSGCILILWSCFRITVLDTLVTNPILYSIAVGSTPVFNALLLIYALPAIWLGLYNRQLNEYLRPLNINTLLLSLLFVFLWLSFNVRQYFHGTILYGTEASNLEVYTYSIVWLLLAVAILIVGGMLKNKQARVISLLLLILTVSKVFLYDAATLSGILRVFSFLGLGLSLIAISWFYARFVFRK